MTLSDARPGLADSVVEIVVEIGFVLRPLNCGVSNRAVGSGVASAKEFRESAPVGGVEIPECPLPIFRDRTESVQLPDNLSLWERTVDTFSRSTDAVRVESEERAPGSRLIQPLVATVMRHSNAVVDVTYFGL
ncbi:MAG: hypothetical protein GY903_18150 [Fuerstiella sp.]|nr:hypothetical protein [Fuerstiella sp.]MCP4856409.1 hypothetical protein [Fuerstiella sp.]